MKYYIEKKKPIIPTFNWLDVSKLIFFIFLLYMNWYKEIWGDRPVILYGSVIALTLSLFVPVDNLNKRFNVDCMTGPFKVFLFLGIYCLFSGIIVSVNIEGFLSSMLTYFCFIVVLLDFCIISYRDGGWSWITKQFIIIALICSLFTVFHGHSMHNGGAVVYTLGPKNNPNTLAYVLIMGLFGLTVHNGYDIKKIIIKLCIVLLLFYTIVLTGSRKILISTIVFIAIWLYSFLKTIRYNLNQSTKAIVLLGIGLSIALVVWYFNAYYRDSDQFHRIMTLFGEDTDASNEDRIRMYKLAFDIWKQHPLFGVGFNQYKYYSWRGDYSHSVYAEVFSCTGILGACVLFIPFIQYLVKIYNHLCHCAGETRYFCAICLAALLVEAFLGIGQIWIYGINHELFIIYVIGLFANMKNKKNEYIEEGDRRICRYIKR